MRRDYQRRKAALNDGRSIGAIATEAQNFDKLFADVKDLLQPGADSCFKFRITDWKSHDRSP
jgi:hypothetical protein